jgi:NADPH:quinone reductase-like Zn-dependent oxidoreductase
MKAIVFDKYGSPDELRFQTVSAPTPEDGEVLVRVHAASINSWDWDLLRGKPFVNRMSFGLNKPKKILSLGCDIAGRVETVGKNVESLKPGDEVFGDVSGGHWGGFAELVCADEKLLAPKPAAMSFQEAAAIPQAGVLAVQGLRHGKIEKAKTVLINGAGGGVGTFAIQLAKMYGAEVTCVDKQEKFEVMQSLGADQVINYQLADFTKSGLQYDLILDVMGFHSLSNYKDSLTPNGSYVMVGGGNRLIFQVMLLGPFISWFGSKKLGVLMHKPDVSDLNRLSALFIEGKLKPVIERVYPLIEVPEAMRYFGTGQVQGKVVIQIYN